MSAGVWFWILYVIGLLFSLYVVFPSGETPNWKPFGGSLLIWLLIGLLGWQVFGAPLK